MRICVFSKVAAELQERARGKVSSEKKLDLAAEVEKVINTEMVDLVDRHAQPYEFSSPKNIFLTGGNGFLGAFLVAELLEKSDVTVTCGVRGRNLDEATYKLTTQLKALDVWQPEYVERVKVVQADLTRPRLGLSQEEFLTLAGQVDSIIHCGAMVHWLFPYEKLKSANVSGMFQFMTSQMSIIYCMR